MTVYKTLSGMYKQKILRLYLRKRRTVQQARETNKEIPAENEDNIMGIFSSFRKKKPTATDILKEELNLTKAELDAAYSHFENVVDPDLISSSIYHINSIQERYKYLMKLIKAVEAENNAKQKVAP